MHFATDAIPKFEPEADIPSLSTPSEAALVSIAISLKRIADAVTVMSRPVMIVSPDTLKDIDLSDLKPGNIQFYPTPRPSGGPDDPRWQEILDLFKAATK